MTNTAELKVEYIPITELVPYAKNAKLHPEEQVEQIKASIRDFGMNDKMPEKVFIEFLTKALKNAASSMRGGILFLYLVCRTSSHRVRDIRPERSGFSPS